MAVLLLTMVHAANFAQACTGLASVGCMVGGIVLLVVASEEAYEKKAAVFGAAVAAWPSHLHKFSSLDMHGSFWNAGFSSAEHPFPSSSNDDASVITNGEDLPRYTPLTYRLSPVPIGFLPTVKFQNIEWLETGADKAEHNGVLLRLNLTVQGNHLMTEPIPLVHATAKSMQQGLYRQCTRQKGSFANGKCWKYERLSRICLQILHDGSRWQFAYRDPAQKASYGCVYKAGNWTPSAYADLDLVPSDPTQDDSNGLNTPTTQTVLFNDVELVVRSVHDPFLKAVEITEGSMDFGMSAQEERLLGLVMLGMAVLLAVPPACSFGFWWHKRSKRRRRPYRINTPAKQRPSEEMVGMKYAVGDDQDEVYDVR